MSDHQVPFSTHGPYAVIVSVVHTMGKGVQFHPLKLYSMTNFNPPVTEHEPKVGVKSALLSTTTTTIYIQCGKILKCTNINIQIRPLLILVSGGNSKNAFYYAKRVPLFFKTIYIYTHFST